MNHIVQSVATLAVATGVALGGASVASASTPDRLPAPTPVVAYDKGKATADGCATGAVVGAAAGGTAGGFAGAAVGTAAGCAIGAAIDAGK